MVYAGMRHYNLTKLILQNTAALLLPSDYICRSLAGRLQSTCTAECKPLAERLDHPSRLFQEAAVKGTG